MTGRETLNEAMDARHRAFEAARVGKGTWQAFGEANSRYMAVRQGKTPDFRPDRPLNRSFLPGNKVASQRALFG